MAKQTAGELELASFVSDHTTSESGDVRVKSAATAVLALLQE